MRFFLLGISLLFYNQTTCDFSVWEALNDKAKSINDKCRKEVKEWLIASSIDTLGVPDKIKFSRVHFSPDEYTYKFLNALNPDSSHWSPKEREKYYYILNRSFCYSVDADFVNTIGRNNQHISVYFFTSGEVKRIMIWGPGANKAFLDWWAN